MSTQDQKEDCCICLELNNDEFELPCKHSVHESCLQQHFKPECPICRMPVSITVTGARPNAAENRSTQSLLLSLLRNMISER